MYNNFTVFKDINDLRVLEGYFFKKINSWFKVNMYVAKKIPEGLNSHESILNYKGCIYKQKDNFVIYLDNTSESYYALIRGICLAQKINAIYCGISNNKMFPCFKMNYFSNGKERILYTMKEQKWVFFESGERQWFEEPEYYNNRIIKNRFNYDIFRRYLKKQNILFENTDFWEPSNDVICFKRECKGTGLRH